jgi:hypothetical membrane protein
MNGRRTDAGRVVGAAGVVAFVTCWAVAGAIRPGYSPVHQAISQLARYGTTHRPLMTAGFAAFAVGALVLGVTVRGVVGAAVAVAGLATAGVALFPLSQPGGGVEDLRHAGCATVAYVALALAPLAGRHRARLPRLSLLFAVATALALALTVPADDTGLWQRIGLTTGDAWLLLLAVRLS